MSCGGFGITSSGTTKDKEKYDKAFEELKEILLEVEGLDITIQDFTKRLNSTYKTSYDNKVRNRYNYTTEEKERIIQQIKKARKAL